MLCLLARRNAVRADQAAELKYRAFTEPYEAAGDIKPKNISIDTFSRAFAGNEIDRSAGLSFAMHMQALALVTGGP